MYDHIILLGVLISLCFTEVTGLSAGLVVPGYLVLCLDSPRRVIYTLILALCAMGLCRLLGRVTILYGRRRFAVLLCLTFFLDMLIQRLFLLPVGWSMIGVLIPGILAREFDRQGVPDTVLALTGTTTLTAAAVLALKTWGGL